MRIMFGQDGRRGKCGVWLVVLLGLLVAAGAGGWILMSGWLKSGGLAVYLKARLTETAGSPVEFERIGFAPFTRVSLHGLRVAGDTAPGAPPTLACRAVQLGFSPVDLLHGKLQFSRLNVDTPHLLVRDGKTGLGPKEGAPGPKSPEKPGAKPTVVLEGATAGWSIDRVEIDNGRAEGVDKKGARLWLVEDLDVHAAVGSGEAGSVRAKGEAGVGLLSLAKGFALTDVKSPFKFENERVDLSDLRFACYGGSGAGRVAADVAGASPKFEADVSLTGVDAGAAAEGLGGESSRVSGTVSLKFKGAGGAGDLNGLRGEGSFAVQPVKFSGSEMLRGLGTLLMLPELANSEFDSLHGRFEVRGGAIVFSEIRTEPRERLQIVASGSVGMDGALNMQGTLSVKSATLNLAPLLTRAGGAQSADGFMDVPFTVKGTTSSPKIALSPAAATGIVGGLLNSLFGGKRQNDPSAQPAAQPEQQPAEAPAEKPVDTLKKLLPFGR